MIEILYGASRNSGSASWLIDYLTNNLFVRVDDPDGNMAQLWEKHRSEPTNCSIDATLLLRLEEIATWNTLEVYKVHSSDFMAWYWARKTLGQAILDPISELVESPGGLYVLEYESGIAAS